MESKSLIIAAIIFVVIAFFLWAIFKTNNLSFRKKKKVDGSSAALAKQKPVNADKENNSKARRLKIKKRNLEEDFKKELEKAGDNKPVFANGGGTIEKVYIEPKPKEEVKQEKEDLDKKDDFESELEQMIKDLEQDRQLNTNSNRKNSVFGPSFETNNSQEYSSGFGGHEFDDNFVGDKNSLNDNYNNYIPQTSDFDTYDDNLVYDRQNHNSDEKFFGGEMLNNNQVTKSRFLKREDRLSNSDLNSPKAAFVKKEYSKEDYTLDNSSFEERYEKGFIKEKKINDNFVIVSDNDKTEREIAKSKRNKWL